MSHQPKGVSKSFQTFLSQAPGQAKAWMDMVHVQSAKQAGASREEIIGAVLVGLPAAGQAVTQVLPVALQAYDSEEP